MVVIDEELGGTTPVDVVIDLAPPNPFGGGGPFADDEAFEDDEFAEEEEFAFGDEDEEDSDSYWFTSDKMERIIGRPRLARRIAGNRQGAVAGHAVEHRL